MATVDVPLERIRFGQTKRKDAWWAMPLVTFIVFSSFVVYATWARSRASTTLRPLPLAVLLARALRRLAARLVRAEAVAVAGPFVPFSPALLILGVPAAFRFTCYYYRGAYYKAFWADPPACAVGEPRKRLPRRAKFPLHPPEHPPLLPLPRAAVPRASCRTTSWKALWFDDPATGHATFGIGVGTLVLLINVVLLGGYTLGCHSLRHLVGGVLDRCRGRRRARRPTTA